MNQINLSTCYTCESPLIPNTKFIMLQCSQCQGKTSYCLLCAKIVEKILGPFLFKCASCKSHFQKASNTFLLFFSQFV